MSLLEKFDAFVKDNDIKPETLIREVLKRAKNRAYSLFNHDLKTKDYDNESETFQISDYPVDYTISFAEDYGDGYCFDMEIDPNIAFRSEDPDYETNKKQWEEFRNNADKKLEDQTINTYTKYLENKGFTVTKG